MEFLPKLSFINHIRSFGSLAFVVSFLIVYSFSFDLAYHALLFLILFRFYLRDDSDILIFQSKVLDGYRGGLSFIGPCNQIDNIVINKLLAIEDLWSLCKCRSNAVFLVVSIFLFYLNDVIAL